MEIPSRMDQVEDKDRRFYVFAPSSVVVRLQQEALVRGIDPWKLGGLVVAMWVHAGCPDAITPREGGV